MNTHSHTSGPWGASRHATPESFPQFGVYAESGNGRDLAHVVSHGTATSAETESNARLIAAAPDLLEALKRVLVYAENEAEYLSDVEARDEEDLGSGDAWDSVHAARQAIAKAEGMAP